MKKRIIILGSTGSIGDTTLSIIEKNQNNFEVVLLSANKNIKKLLNQSKKFNVKNLVITDKKKFLIVKKKFLGRKINIFNNFNSFYSRFNKKIDYTMCAITGTDGLSPTLQSIKFTKNIGIANKEAIICAWNLIKKSLKKYKCNFTPIDSEHFSINELIKNSSNKMIDEVIITASGGPFLKYPLKKFKKIKPHQAVKHPKWKMGEKISIDSATLMNKIFELIEAKKIFNLNINQLKILIHPNSYVHAIVKFKNGLSKILIHDTNMNIPIFNWLYDNNKKLITNKIDLKLLNDLNFTKVDVKKFPSINLIKKIPFSDSLFETVIVSANDELVSLFLKNKISFLKIWYVLNKITNLKQFTDYKKKYPYNIGQILDLSETVRLKTKSFCID
jgi:1-deoxy-D-xylulose-5-phosphate reductoisomerase